MPSSNTPADTIRTIVSHPIHASLYRPVLFLGVEQTVAMIEATLLMALLVGVGLHITTLLLAGLIIGVIHPIMVWLTTADAEISRVYIRSLRNKDFYPAHVALHSSPFAVRSSIPLMR